MVTQRGPSDRTGVFMCAHKMTSPKPQKEILFTVKTWSVHSTWIKLWMKQISLYLILVGHLNNLRIFSYSVGITTPSLYTEFLVISQNTILSDFN